MGEVLQEGRLEMGITEHQESVKSLWSGPAVMGLLRGYLEVTPLLCVFIPILGFFKDDETSC